MPNDEYKNILLVDDHLKIQEIIADFLRNNAMRVQVSNSITHARKMTAEKNYDLIIADLFLPKTDGMTFIREIAETTATPFIITANNQEDVDQIKDTEGLSDCAIAILTKPFSKALLLETIQNAFEN